MMRYKVLGITFCLVWAVQGRDLPTNAPLVDAPRVTRKMETPRVFLCQDDLVFSMATVHPDPRFDYKIATLAPDPEIDFKIKRVNPLEIRDSRGSP